MPSALPKWSKAPSRESSSIQPVPRFPRRKSPPPKEAAKEDAPKEVSKDVSKNVDSKSQSEKTKTSIGGKSGSSSASTSSSASAKTIEAKSGSKAPEMKSGQKLAEMKSAKLKSGKMEANEGHASPSLAPAKILDLPIVDPANPHVPLTDDEKSRKI